jgi:FkbM family methyltransferase
MDVFDNRVRHAFLTNSYEASEIELIDEYVTGSYDLVDLGASTGFTTVYGLSKLDERARSIAVEANPEMIPVMESVQKMNDVKFDIESAAYDPEQSEVDFHVHDKTVSSSTKRQGGSKMTIPTVSMADIVAKHGIEEFVCLVDIEGGEIGLVQEELELLEKTCAIIIIEIHEMDGIATETKHQMADSEFELADTSGDVYVYLNDAF